jgi:hypothetical protein
MGYGYDVLTNNWLGKDLDHGNCISGCRILRAKTLAHAS